MKNMKEKSYKIQEFLNSCILYLTKGKTTSIIILASKNGEVAQLARAFGSYPKGHVFESHLRYQAKNS